LQLEHERDHLKTELTVTVASKHPSTFSANDDTSFSRYMNDLRDSGSDNGSPTSASVMSPIEERNKLRAELDEATRELTRFHKEMDGLSVQLNGIYILRVCTRNDSIFGYLTTPACHLLG
jgi:hypothetical protein